MARQTRYPTPEVEKFSSELLWPVVFVGNRRLHICRPKHLPKPGNNNLQLHSKIQPSKIFHRFVSLILVCEFLFYFSPLLAAAARIPVHGPRKVGSTCHVVHRESRKSCTDRYTFSIYDRGFRAWSVLPVPGFCVRTEFPPNNLNHRHYGRNAERNSEDGGIYCSKRYR